MCIVDYEHNQNKDVVKGKKKKIQGRKRDQETAEIKKDNSRFVNDFSRQVKKRQKLKLLTHGWNN